jgi:PadR family transcriptional regulator PadR
MPQFRQATMTTDFTDTESHLRKFQKELSAGTVSLVLLAVLAGSDEPLYGYQIAKRLQQSGDALFSGKQSALYPVLRNLSAGGLLDSHVEPSVAGPPRRYYSITALGLAVFSEWVATWEATRQSVDSVLKGSTP